MTRSTGLQDSEVQLVIANLFDASSPQIIDSVLGYDPYTTPSNPRTIGLMLTKRF